jgi:hypothetical protein
VANKVEINGKAIESVMTKALAWPKIAENGIVRVSTPDGRLSRAGSVLAAILKPHGLSMTDHASAFKLATEIDAATKGAITFDERDTTKGIAFMSRDTRKGIARAEAEAAEAAKRKRSEQAARALALEFENASAMDEIRARNEGLVPAHLKSA